MEAVLNLLVCTHLQRSEGNSVSRMDMTIGQMRRYLLLNDLVHHVSGMDVNGTDGHDFLPVSRSELADQHGDEGV